MTNTNTTDANLRTLCRIAAANPGDARAQHAAKRAEERSAEQLPTFTDGRTPDGRPIVGAGGAYSIGSDRYAFTVVSVSKSGHQVKVRRDRAKRVDGNGWSESQEWVFFADESAELETLTRRNVTDRDGLPRYALKGCKGYGYASFGKRRAYQDPGF